MAEKEKEFYLETPQKVVLMCEKHNLPIEISCEKCRKFICSTCVKNEHRKHYWQTIQTAATLKRTGLLESMRKIKEEDIKQMDDQIHRAYKQMEENKKRCESEVCKLMNHCDAIIEKLCELRRNHEKTLRGSLDSRNDEISKARSNLEDKKKRALERVKYITENGSTMSDATLLEAHRELTNCLSVEDDDTEKTLYEYLLRYECGDINEAVLDSIMGETYDAEKITLFETDSFQCGDEPITLLKVINENTCFLNDRELQAVVRVHKSGKSEKRFSVNVNDVCVTDKNEFYATNCNKSVSRLSPSGSVSSVFSTHPLTPEGICQTMYHDFLVTLRDADSGDYQPNPRSRRLVRHVTLTGDVIREYEYLEDGQTRLFTVPLRVTQNGNTDICVVNRTSDITGELVILSFSGSMKFVYPEPNQRGNFNPTDVVCDSHSNIIVNELQSSTINLLSQEGRLLRYLLNRKRVGLPFALSLRGPALWIGNDRGLVKVFQYKP